jgi:hypothetical protein
MLVDIENLSSEALKNIIASKGALDAALRRRASAQEEIDRCKANLRGLGVGIDGEMPTDPEPRGVVANGGGIVRNPVTGRTRKEKPAGASRPRAPRGIDPNVVEKVRTCLGDTAKTIPQIVDDTGLHRGIVTRVLAHISAIGSGGPKSTRYRIADGAPPQTPIPEVEDEDEPAQGDLLDDGDEG